jgi:hypothetical protein
MKPSAKVRAPFVVVAVVTAAGSVWAAGESWGRRFADRPVAWEEHDDQDVAAPPAPTHLADLDLGLRLRDSVAVEADRIMSLEADRPAEDVNALDEVPCSSWFCPRNHLRPMTPAAVAAGPPGAPEPRPPLRITKGKDQGATLGFQVRDADGRKFMLKLDPPGHVGMMTGAEMIGERVFHAAGYNVPGAFLLDLSPADLTVDPKATFHLYGVQPRPLSRERVTAMLARASRLADGRFRAVATPWIGGQIVGGFDMIGRRPDDPNDRIAHQHRRSLRASWLLFAWLGEIDPGSRNSLDSYVRENGRRFVRHYLIDFGATLGSQSVGPKGIETTGEYMIEVGRTLGALVGLGFYQRPFQDEKDEWRRAVNEHPAVGWFPAEGFDPDTFRTGNKVPAHMRKTARDLYWGAKVVTSFTDAQIDAIVATARLPPSEEAYLARALRVRRDIIGRRYLRAVTALENPGVTPDGAAVCFDDLAIGRGYARRDELRYEVTVTSADGRPPRHAQQPPGGARTCVPLGGAPVAGGYETIEVRARLAGPGTTSTATRAARIHARWRESERRFVVVGLDREE